LYASVPQCDDALFLLLVAKTDAQTVTVIIRNNFAQDEYFIISPIESLPLKGIVRCRTVIILPNL
jgi:hypothetical protein